MFFTLTSKRNKKFLLKLSQKLTVKTEDEKIGFIKGYIFYGSHVLNLNTHSSDVDTIAFVSYRDGIEKKEYQIDNVLVKLYLIGTGNLLEDAKKLRWGTYFIAKLLNPYIIIGRNRKEKLEIKQEVSRALGTYLYPDLFFRLKKKGIYSSNFITAQTYLMYLARCPFYLPYLMKYLVGRKRNAVWGKMKENILDALATVQSITVKANLVRCKELRKSSIFEQSNRESEIMAKFWNYLVIYHNNDIRFLDSYFSKTKTMFKEMEGWKFAQTALNFFTGFSK